MDNVSCYIYTHYYWIAQEKEEEKKSKLDYFIIQSCFVSKICCTLGIFLFKKASIYEGIIALIFLSIILIWFW